jgi:hypothetical protein
VLTLCMVLSVWSGCGGRCAPAALAGPASHISCKACCICLATGNLQLGGSRASPHEALAPWFHPPSCLIPLSPPPPHPPTHTHPARPTHPPADAGSLASSSSYCDISFRLGAMPAGQVARCTASSCHFAAGQPDWVCDSVTCSCPNGCAGDGTDYRETLEGIKGRVTLSCDAKTSNCGLVVRGVVRAGRGVGEGGGVLREGLVGRRRAGYGRCVCVCVCLGGGGRREGLGEEGGGLHGQVGTWAGTRSWTRGR